MLLSRVKEFGLVLVMIMDDVVELGDGWLEVGVEGKRGAGKRWAAPHIRDRTAKPSTTPTRPAPAACTPPPEDYESGSIHYQELNMATGLDFVRRTPVVHDL